MTKSDNLAEVFDAATWIATVIEWRGSAVYLPDGWMLQGDAVISPTTTDAQLEPMAEALESCARDDDVILDPGALEALRALRDEAQKREAEREDRDELL